MAGAAGSRRNPGKDDGVSWNSGKSFICPAAVDGDYKDTELDDETFVPARELAPAQEMVPSPLMTICLLDIARPIKRKGLAKDFEVVKKPQHVIALEDVEGSLEEDDWECIYVAEVKQTRTYSAVLHGDVR